MVLERPAHENLRRFTIDELNHDQCAETSGFFSKLLEHAPNLKSVQRALNIQTLVNLHGYFYRNVYEQCEVVNFDDPKVRWVRG